MNFQRQDKKEDSGKGTVDKEDIQLAPSKDPRLHGGEGLNSTEVTSPGGTKSRRVSRAAGRLNAWKDGKKEIEEEYWGGAEEQGK